MQTFARMAPDAPQFLEPVIRNIAQHGPAREGQQFWHKGSFGLLSDPIGDAIGSYKVDRFHQYLAKHAVKFIRVRNKRGRGKDAQTGCKNLQGGSRCIS